MFSQTLTAGSSHGEEALTKIEEVGVLLFCDDILEEALQCYTVGGRSLDRPSIIHSKEAEPTSFFCVERLAMPPTLGTEINLNKRVARYFRPWSSLPCLETTC